MIGDKKILSVITARAGSVGIPGKNFRELLGKPLFMWSMLAAENSKYVDGIILSSNCKECLNICEEYTNKRRKDKRLFGWIIRPEKYCTEISKNEEALIHTLEFLDEKYDVVINLQPTSPCRLNSLLDRAIEAYYEGGYDSLLTANRDTPFIWQKRDGKWKYIVDRNHPCDRKMRQEFSEDEFIFHDNGNIYLVESKILLDLQCRIGYNPCIFETVGLNSLQIDDEYTFMVIEKMIEAKGLDSLI